MTLYMITKQKHVLVLLYEAVRCCRASLEGAAFLSGRQVRLCSRSVICYAKYFTSALNTINKKLWFWHNKTNTCSVSSIGGCTLLSRVVGGTRTPKLATKPWKEAHYRHLQMLYWLYVLKWWIVFERSIILLLHYIM